MLDAPLRIFRCYICIENHLKAPLMDISFLIEHLALHFEFHLYECRGCEQKFATPFNANFHIKEGQCKTEEGELLDDGGPPMKAVELENVEFASFCHLENAITKCMELMLYELNLGDVDLMDALKTNELIPKYPLSPDPINTEERQMQTSPPITPPPSMEVEAAFTDSQTQTEPSAPLSESVSLDTSLTSTADPACKGGRSADLVLSMISDDEEEQLAQESQNVSMELSDGLSTISNDSSSSRETPTPPPPPPPSSPPPPPPPPPPPSDPPPENLPAPKPPPESPILPPPPPPPVLLPPSASAGSIPPSVLLSPNTSAGPIPPPILLPPSASAGSIPPPVLLPPSASAASIPSLLDLQFNHKLDSDLPPRRDKRQPPANVSERQRQPPASTSERPPAAPPTDYAEPDSSSSITMQQPFFFQPPPLKSKRTLSNPNINSASDPVYPVLNPVYSTGVRIYPGPSHANPGFSGHPLSDDSLSSCQQHPFYDGGPASVGEVSSSTNFMPFHDERRLSENMPGFSQDFPPPLRVDSPVQGHLPQDFGGAGSMSFADFSRPLFEAGDYLDSQAMEIDDVGPSRVDRFNHFQQINADEWVGCEMRANEPHLGGGVRQQPRRYPNRRDGKPWSYAVRVDRSFDPHTGTTITPREKHTRGRSLSRDRSSHGRSRTTDARLRASRSKSPRPSYRRRRSRSPRESSSRRPGSTERRRHRSPSNSRRRSGSIERGRHRSRSGSPKRSRSVGRHRGTRENFNIFHESNEINATSSPVRSRSRQSSTTLDELDEEFEVKEEEVYA